MLGRAHSSLVEETGNSRVSVSTSESLQIMLQYFFYFLIYLFDFFGLGCRMTRRFMVISEGGIVTKKGAERMSGRRIGR